MKTKKLPKTFKGKSMKLGKGGRFAKGEAEIAAKFEKKGVSPAKAKKIGGAIMAKVGRAKFGAKKMAKMAATGRHRKDSAASKGLMKMNRGMI